MQGFGAAGMVTIKGERCPKMHRDDGTITRPCKISSWTSWELVMVGLCHRRSYRVDRTPTPCPAALRSNDTAEPSMTAIKMLLPQRAEHDSLRSCVSGYP